jgi:hypothetical protein
MTSPQERQAALTAMHAASVEKCQQVLGARLADVLVDAALTAAAQVRGRERKITPKFTSLHDEYRIVTEPDSGPDDLEIVRAVAFTEGARMMDERYRPTLQSIANSTCCEGCQEAAKWARAALNPR